MMQQLVGGADPASPLEVDWDTGSVTSTEQAEDEKSPGMQKLVCLCTPYGGSRGCRVAYFLDAQEWLTDIM